MKKTMHKKAPARREWPAVVYFWIFGMIFVSYIVGRIAFDGFPHPLHWTIAIAGGLLGIPIGWMWYRWKGDLF